MKYLARRETISKNLKVLYIQGNFITEPGCGSDSNCCELEPGMKCYESLEEIHLSFSPSFKRIPSFMPKLFPNLKNLQVNVCPLGNDFIRSECIFENVTNLSVIKSEISKISIFDKISASFPKLTHLATSDNTFENFKKMTETDIKTVRQIAIAKIPTLMNLNRSDNEKRERLEAEIDYLKRFAKSENQVFVPHLMQFYEVLEF